MTELERQINHSLRALDRAHLLGRISRDEYRARRRRLLASLANDSHVVTARIAINKAGAASAKTIPIRAAPASQEQDAALSKMFSANQPAARKYLIAFAIGIIACAVLLYWWLHAG